VTVLNVSQYDESYFEGDVGRGGYTSYSKWIKTLSKYAPYESSKGDTWKNPAARLVKHYKINGSLLELGCAYGHTLKQLQDADIKDTHGIDVSQFAIDNSVASNTVVGDAIESLKRYEDNKFDFIYSAEFLQCINEKDLPPLISEMNRVAKHRQFHIINIAVSPKYYNIKNMTEWINYQWMSNTILVPITNIQKEYIVN